jgi:hypothetical protein
MLRTYLILFSTFLSQHTLLKGYVMNIQLGVALKKVRRVARVSSTKSKRRISRGSSSVLGKTLKVAGKLTWSLTRLASIVLIGKL